MAHRTRDEITGWIQEAVDRSATRVEETHQIGELASGLLRQRGAGPE